MAMDTCESFLPHINTQSKILILGSMPGIKSLEYKQYYAHPQNRFWKLMGLLLNCANLSSLTYEDKLNILSDNQIALWDVIRFCNRQGSMDLNIENEIPNDFKQLLKHYNNIQIICFNGNKAYLEFKKHYPELLSEYKCYKLPSTSPANARFTIEDLYKIWNCAIKQVIS